VIADNGRVRVPIYMTDAMPSEYRAAISRRTAVFDALNHQPHYADLTDARLQDGLRKAAEARDAWIRGLQDAWRTPSGQMAQPPDNGADQPDDDPRAAYIRRVSNAWRTPPDLPARDPDDDDDPKAAATAVEAQRRRWNAETPAKDAALADRDVAYGEYLDYVQNAWKRPCGAVAGGRR
jgi:hypothetical protein